MGTRSDVHFLGLRSPCRAAGVRHSEFSFAQLWVDSSRLRAKVNCECLTPAVVLHALRNVRAGHPSPATPDRRTPLAQGLMASLTGHIRSSEHKHPADWPDVVGGASRETPRPLRRHETGPRSPRRQGLTFRSRKAYAGRSPSRANGSARPRAAGVRHSEFSFAQPRVDSSRLRAKVNCECLTPAVVLYALRNVRSGHPSTATPDRRTPLAQGSSR